MSAAEYLTSLGVSAGLTDLGVQRVAEQIARETDIPERHAAITVAVYRDRLHQEDQ